MGERRNHKSSWDLEKETKQLSGMTERNSWEGKERHSRHGRYDEFYGSGTTAATNSRDDSEWQSRELIEEIPIAQTNGRYIKSKLDAPEGREIDGGNRYYRNLSPVFDGINRRNYNHALENERSYSHRFSGRGRSRSRSRSRSLSRGRDSGRGSGWRSRSKSRSDGSERDRTQSRSPIGDYRRQSHGWSDRKSGPDKPSQVCRDFAAGSCRRGSQCRFFHPDNTSRRDGDLMEDDTAGGSWRQKTDNGSMSRHSYSRGHGYESQNDMSDSYKGEKEQFQSKSRTAAIPCKDFMRGKCRSGDSCRFSHHFTSDDGFDQGNRNTSCERDIERQVNKNVKPICKYFAAGKCDRDNCRFSHEDPKHAVSETRRTDVTESHGHGHDKSLRWDGPTWDDAKPTVLETRRTNVTESHGYDKSLRMDGPTRDDAKRAVLETRKTDFTENHVYDKRPRWDGPTWDNATRVTDSVKPTGWGQTVVTNMIGTDEASKRKGDSGWGHGLENSSWGIPESTYNSLNREKQPSPPRGTGIYGGGTSNTGSVKDNMFNKSEHLAIHHSHLNDVILNAQGNDELREDQTLSMKAWQNNVSPAAPHIQQQLSRIAEFNRVNSFGSSILDGVASRETTHPMVFSGHNLNLNGEGMFRGHSSNELGTDLNEPETRRADPSDLQDSLQYHQEAVQFPVIPELNVSHSFPNLFNREHSVQTINSPITGQQGAPLSNTSVFPTQGVVSEQSQVYPGIHDPDSMGKMMPSFSAKSENVPFASTVSAHTNPVTFSLDLLNRIRNGGGTSEHRDYNVRQATEPNHQMNVEQSSPPSIIGEKIGNMDVKHPESPKKKQEDLVANPEDNGCNEVSDEENKETEENKGDGYAKVEEGSASKDKKAMRLFKNALIEFVKEVLKPKWKEGRMSRDAHKTIVKKVVDKVTSTVQVDQVPKTQEKVELYLSNAKPKISKLIQAYVDRCPKTDPKKE